MVSHVKEIEHLPTRRQRLAQAIAALFLWLKENVDCLVRGEREERERTVKRRCMFCEGEGR